MNIIDIIPKHLLQAKRIKRGMKVSQKTRKKAKRKKPTRKKNRRKKKRTKKKMAPTTNQNLKLRKNLLCWIIWNPWKVKFICLHSWVRKQHRRRKIQRLVSNSIKSMSKKIKLILFTDNSRASYNSFCFLLF